MSIPRVAAALVAACACATASAQAHSVLPSELTTPVVTPSTYYVRWWCWGLPCKQWTFTWEAEKNSGGHTHQNIPRAPGELTILYPEEAFVISGCAKGSCASGRITVNTNPNDPDSSVFTKLVVPEVSSRIKLCGVTDTWPGSPLCGTIEVKREGLARPPFASGGTFWATPIVERRNGPSHLPWEGFGTNSTNMRLERLAWEYNDLLIAAINAHPGRVAHNVKISAISMRQGGLADVDGAHEWMPPHINHRAGRQVDVSMQGLENWEKNLLRQAILAAGFQFTVWLESPNNPNLCQPGDPGGCHWHIE